MSETVCTRQQEVQRTILHVWAASVELRRS